MDYTTETLASDSDSDAQLASPSRAKNNRRIKEDDYLLLLSTGSTFVASSSAAAKQLLLHRLSQTHIGGHVFTRGSDTQSVYICCRSCTMKCRAGCKKQDLQAWRITACCDRAMEACPGERHPSQTGAPYRNSSTDIPEDSAALSIAPLAPPPAIPSLLAPFVQNPVEDFPVGPEVECMACNEVKRVTLCPQGHAWCLRCFEGNLLPQCNPTDEHQGIQKFLQRRGVICTICPPAEHGKVWTFDMEKLSVL